MKNNVYSLNQTFLERNATSATYLLAATASSMTWEIQQPATNGRFHEVLPDVERVVVYTSGVVFSFLSYFLLFIIMSSLILVFETIRKRKQAQGNQTTALQDLREVVFPNSLRWLKEMVHLLERALQPPSAQSAAATSHARGV